MSQDLVIVRFRLGNPWNRLFGNNQYVRGRVRLHVLERDHFIVLKNDGSRNLSRDDLLAQRLAHVPNLLRSPHSVKSKTALPGVHSTTSANSCSRFSTLTHSLKYSTIRSCKD